MGRRGLFKKAHPIFFRNLTIFGASLGIIGSTAFAGIMGTDAVRGDLIVDEVREYTASFSSEGSIITKGTYKRGEDLEIPENPEHSIDGENNYFFIGWDTNGNGIPDYVPKKAYYSFDAEAVYFTTGKFDLDFLDLLNMDLEDLLKLLEDLNIDWEQFMSMFNIDPEMLMDWLMSQTVLTFETTPSSSEYPTYFRSTSYGNFDYAKKSFRAPDYYDSSLISDGSVNPLSYTAYKLHKLDEMGLLPYGFGFTNYDITFNAVEDYYPVPDCESSNSMNEFIDSDAHYLDQSIDNHYETSAAYCPAIGYVIDLFNALPLTGAVGRDEKAYYKYALENYTEIPHEYEDVIDGMIEENGWYEGELYQVDEIAYYVSSLGQCSLFNDDGSVDMSSYMNMQKKASDPVRDLIRDKKGSDLDFNTTAVMLFRRLKIPARLVKGYVAIGSQPGENSITLFNQHYWCEIYVKGTGWMICDCMDMTNFLGTNPYEGLVKENTPLENKHILDHIRVTAPAKKEYFVGEDLEIAGGSLTAYFQDDSTSRMRLNASGVELTGFDSSEPGDCTVRVGYTYEGVTKFDTFQVKIKAQNANLVNVVFNFEGAKKKYYVNDKLDTSGVLATAYYDDDTTANVSNRLSYNALEVFDAEGNFDVVAFYTENGVTFSDFYVVNVVKDYPTSLEIITPPTKTKYFVADKLLLDGLSIKITYESGKSVQRDYMGSVDDQIDEVEFSISIFDTVNANQPVYVRLWNDKTASYVSGSFNVEVVKNNMLNITPNNFKTSYSMGEYFDIDEFVKDSYFVCEMDNGKKVKIYQDDAGDDIQNYDAQVQVQFSVSAPSLDAVGGTSATVSFDYNDETYSVPIGINVSQLDTSKFVFNQDESGTTAGPGGTGLTNTSMFSYTTSHVGTMYFRNASYDQYSPRGWSNSGSNTTLNYSPNAFTYDKAQQVYETDSVTISYTSDFPYGVVPSYSNATGQDNYEISGNKTTGNAETYSFTNFDLTWENLYRLSSSYIPYSGSNQSNQNTYRNNYAHSRYLSVGNYNNEEAYTLIEDYINKSEHQYHLYDEAAAIVKVRDDLYTEFNYDPGFRYTDASVDPVVSFFKQGIGGSKTFATVATIIYRHLNIPARYVTGFGSYSSGGTTTVTARDAHAWCEVYYDNLGWVIVDPTRLDTGMMRGSSGTYGGGFGGSGLYTFAKPVYTGEVSISYDYASEFVEDTTVPVDDPARWSTVYDDEDHHKIATFTLSPGSDQLPSYLEYRIVFEWYRNDEYVSTTIATDPNEKAPTASYGQYVLIPRIQIIDKTTGGDVTAEHNYTLAPGTENMEYFIEPAFIYAFVIGTKDSYSMNGQPTIVLYAGKNSDIYFDTTMPEDIIALGFFSELPDTITIDISGYFIYEGEGGTITISYENIEVDAIASSYSGDYDWDKFNIIVIPYFGEVVINP